MMRIAWVTLALGVVVAFGAVVPDYYMAADDLHETWAMYELDRGDRGLTEKITGVVFRAEGGGHFRPVQDLVYVTLYELFGIDRWIFAVMVLYAFCHVASGALIVAILRRLGSPGPLALVAALLFVLHPVWDENLVSVTFGNNVPGVTFLLWACLLWIPRQGSSRRQDVLRYASSAALLCVATGLGINLLVSGAVLLGCITVATAWARRSAAELVTPGVALSAAIGASFLHRWLAYGAIGTRHGHYRYLEPRFDLTPFVQAITDGAVLLAPSPLDAWTRGWNPPGLTWDRRVPLWSADTALVVAAAIGIVGVIVMTARKGGTPPPEPQRPSLVPSLWFGLAFTLATVMPYFLFVGEIGAHRYLYPSVAGLAITATMIAGIAGRASERIVSRVVINALGVFSLFLVTVILLKVDREAARSIAAGHRVTRSIVEAVASDLSSHPEVKHVFVVGYPRVIGRTGYSIVFPGHLIGVLNAKLGRRMVVTNTDYFEAYLAGWLPASLPKDVALYAVAPDGMTVGRVPKGSAEQLPEHVVREGYLAVSREWKLDQDGEVLVRLASDDPVAVRLVLDILVDHERGSRIRLLASALERSPPSVVLKQASIDSARRGPENARLVAAAWEASGVSLDDSLLAITSTPTTR